MFYRRRLNTAGLRRITYSTTYHLDYVPTPVEWRYGAAFLGYNDANEFGEVLHDVGWAPRRKHVVPMRL